MDLTKQERYRKRLRAKAGWFDYTDADRKGVVRRQIEWLRRTPDLSPEQEAMFPLFLSHPMARSVPILEQRDGSWLAYGSRDEMLLALVAFRRFSSAPACFQHTTNSGSAAVSDFDPELDRIRREVADLKTHGLWVTE